MIKPPIVIDAQGDLLIFNSLSAALRELSPLDVQNGHYPVAYDSEGRLLRIEVRTHERRILGLFPEVTEQVVIVPYEHIPTHDQALRALLLRFIQPRAAAEPATPSKPAEDMLRTSPPA